MKINIPHLHQNRHGIYYLRLVLPVELQYSAGRKEIRRSLKTKDVYQAITMVGSFVQAMSNTKRPFHWATIKGELQGYYEQVVRWLAESLQ